MRNQALLAASPRRRVGGLRRARTCGTSAAHRRTHGQ
jgi:hypothetical protein